jgi:hypothetical protein
MDEDMRGTWIQKHHNRNDGLTLTQVLECLPQAWALSVHQDECPKNPGSNPHRCYNGGDEDSDAEHYLPRGDRAGAEPHHHSCRRCEWEKCQCREHDMIRIGHKQADEPKRCHCWQHYDCGPLVALSCGGSHSAKSSQEDAIQKLSQDEVYNAEGNQVRRDSEIAKGRDEDGGNSCQSHCKEGPYHYL